MKLFASSLWWKSLSGLKTDCEFLAGLPADSEAARQQSGALSLVGIVEAWLSLVKSFIELKYFHAIKNQLVASKAPYSLLLAGSLWHKG